MEEYSITIDKSHDLNISNIKVVEDIGSKPVELNQDIETSLKPCKTKIIPKSINSGKKKRKRCGTCSKKLTLFNEFICKCEKIYCSTHLHSSQHDCTFDHKEKYKCELIKNNIKVAPDKIKDRI